jgi:dolichol-phosphate mannosyltransferase
MSLSIASNAIDRLRGAEESHKELVRFLLVGGSGTILNMVVLAGLHSGLGWSLIVGGVISNEAALIWNFFCHEHWTFAGDRHGNRVTRFLRFQSVATGGIAISLTILNVLDHFGVPYLLANAVGIVIAVVWNFLMSYRWAWRRVPVPELEALVEGLPPTV